MISTAIAIPNMALISITLFVVLAMSMTVHDDTVAGAFGPSARNVKIKNLRTYPFNEPHNAR